MQQKAAGQDSVRLRNGKSLEVAGIKGSGSSSDCCELGWEYDNKSSIQGEGREKGENVSAEDNVDGQAAKSGELHVCLALALLGEGVDKTERRKERKHQQGN